MAVVVFVSREGSVFEPRVAASGESVKRLSGLGFSVIVEKGAGERSRIPDAVYAASGAVIGSAADAAKADVILKVRRPEAAEMAGYRRGAIVVAIMDPYGNDAALAALAKAGLTAFAMELMPRITRAQSMDVLSSQANLAGYRAVIDAAHEFDRAMPMMMTAAGTVPAAKVFVMGAGVAGLQAIATARRLGAAVSATDVRPAAKEQVASLGGKFVAVEDDEFKAAETAGGYAREMSKAYQAKQAELVADHISKQDIVVATALIPGRPAPRLVTKAMLKTMKPGSVAVDLAVERGGNIEGSVAGKVVAVEGVTVIGYDNMPGRVATSASLLYAKNLFTFLEALTDREAGTIKLDMEDPIVKATLLTNDGQVVHEAFRSAASAAPEEPARDQARGPGKKPAAKRAPASAAAKRGPRKPADGSAGGSGESGPASASKKGEQ